MASDQTLLHRRSLVAIIVAAALVIVLVIGFFLNSRSFDNKGGATTCAEFKDMSADQRQQTVLKLLQDTGQPSQETNVTIGLVSSLLFCQTVGQATDPISGMYTIGATPTP